MKRMSVLATVLLSVSLAQFGLAQSNPSTTTTKDQTKQDQKTAKTKAKANKDESKAHSGKKTTTTQDAAYALAYRSGIPKQ